MDRFKNYLGEETCVGDTVLCLYNHMTGSSTRRNVVCEAVVTGVTQKKCTVVIRDVEHGCYNKLEGKQKMIFQDSVLHVIKRNETKE